MKTTTATLTLPLLFLASLLTIQPAATEETAAGSGFALDGTWVLDRQVIVHGEDSYVSPFAGRTLIVSGDGEFTEDYSTEEHVDPDLTPKFAVSGFNTGILRIERVAAAENPENAYRLFVRHRQPAGDAPRVEYEGEVRKAGPSLPLGFGKMESLADGRWTVCDITVNTDADGVPAGFEITNGSRAKVVWSFRKRDTLPLETPVLLSQTSTK